jgi:hypothetical protein
MINSKFYAPCKILVFNGKKLENGKMVKCYIRVNTQACIYSKYGKMAKIGGIYGK